MKFDMVCACGASITVEVLDDENTLGGWMFIHRFANAHISCGYVTEYESGDPFNSSIDVEMRENNDN